MGGMGRWDGPLRISTPHQPFQQPTTHYPCHTSAALSQPTPLHPAHSTPLYPTPQHPHTTNPTSPHPTNYHRRLLVGSLQSGTGWLLSPHRMDRHSGLHLILHCATP